MSGTEISSETSIDLWRGAPAADADEEDWLAYKQHTYDDFIHLIRAVDRELSAQPYLRLEQLRRLRREHHLILVADRIRREAPASRRLTREELRTGAERIVDRGARLGANRADEARPRSHADEKMMISARVHWHKLLRKADSRAELRGMWGGKRHYSGIKTVVGRIMGQRAKKATEQALREHIRDRLEQLIAVSNEVLERARIAPSRQDRLLLRELEALLWRVRAAASQANDSRARVGPRGTIRGGTGGHLELETGDQPALSVDQEETVTLGGRP